MSIPSNLTSHCGLKLAQAPALFLPLPPHSINSIQARLWLARWPQSARLARALSSRLLQDSSRSASSQFVDCDLTDIFRAHVAVLTTIRTMAAQGAHPSTVTAIQSGHRPATVKIATSKIVAATRTSSRRFPTWTHYPGAISVPTSRHRKPCALQALHCLLLRSDQMSSDMQ